jgi:hypothetical protein
VLYAVVSCSLQSCGACAADRGSAFVVLVVGCDVADAGVQSDGVVLGSHAGQFGVERAGVTNGGQVRPVGFEVAVEAFDVRLVGRLTG